MKNPQLERRLSNLGVSVLGVGRREPRHEQRFVRASVVRSWSFHAFSALGVGREAPLLEHHLSDLGGVSVPRAGHQEPQRGHRLSDFGVATSVLNVACREVPQEIAILDDVCEVSVPLAAVVEDSARQAARALVQD